MQSPSFLVANLRSLSGGDASISFSCHTSNNAACDSSQVPAEELDGVRYLIEGDVHDRRYLQAFKKNKKRAEKMIQFFGGSEQKCGFTRAPSVHGLATSSMHVTGVALIGGQPSKDCDNDIERVTSFQEIQFTFPSIAKCKYHGRFQSTQFVRCLAPTMKVEKQLFRMDRENTYRSVSIISGMCLFNASLWNRTKNTERRTTPLSLLSYNNMTLYEMEFIARCAPAIADITAHIISNRHVLDQHSPGDLTLPVTVILDIPSVHYYNSIHECLETHGCTPDEALTWMSAIEKRSSMLARVFRQAVSHEVERRIGPSAPHQFTIEPPSRLESAMSSHLRQELECQRLPKLDTLLEILDARGDESWRRFRRLLRSRTPPRTFQELGYLFHVYQCLRPSLRSGLPVGEEEEEEEEAPCVQAAGKKCLLIGVDDDRERPLYTRAQTLLKELGRRADACPEEEGYTPSDLFEIYLAPRILTNSDGMGSNLYLNDPSPGMPVLRQLPEQRPHEHGHEGAESDDLATYSLCLGDGRFSPVEVVGTLYGTDLPGNLENWFAEAAAG